MRRRSRCSDGTFRRESRSTVLAGGRTVHRTAAWAASLDLWPARSFSSSLAAESGGDWAATTEVSALQFAQEELTRPVLDTLATTELPPSRLVLGRTEQSLVADHVEVRARMRA